MSNPFFQLGIVFIFATLLGAAVRFFKQPLILAYILTGFFLGFLGLTRLASQETLALLSKFGIAFLLFMVGLELKLTDFKQVGKVAFLVGLGQIIFTFLAGFLLSLTLGFAWLSSLYIAIALTFSSTVIVIKLLLEKNDLASLYGKVAIGILLIQDLVAILILMFLAGFQVQASPSFLSFLLVLVKGLAFFVFISFLVKKWIPLLFQIVAQSQELLFLTAVAWCFLFASLSLILGFSLEIGAFLAGVSLSSLPYHYQISARIKPLRDLFITLFFVGLGMQMILAPGLNFLIPALIFSAFVLTVKPLTVLLTMGWLGFRKRTSFFTASSLAQISEFSFILMAMGQGLGHVANEDVSLVTGVGIMTITVSSYLILKGQRIYQGISPYLSFLERETPHEKRSSLEKPPEDHVVLIGCNRMGGDILEFLKKKDQPYLVLDFNPEVIRWLEAQEVPCLFGDVTDEEILDQLNLGKAKIVISTVPNLDDNFGLIRRTKIKNSAALVLVTASYPEEEEELYRAGADYVILPQLLGGKHIAHLLAEHEDNLEEYLYSKRKSK